LDYQKEYSKRRPSVEAPIVTGSTYRLFLLEISDSLAFHETPQFLSHQDVGCNEDADHDEKTRRMAEKYIWLNVFNQLTLQNGSVSTPN
jgi:hypothetical protein